MLKIAGGGVVFQPYNISSNVTGATQDQGRSQKKIMTETKSMVKFSW